ncbi:hypothetical protein EVG20_g4548 [Dentipellis fragilis]|uniref:Uncharacterized protein n=1 Tax=Dentipellis fragilis TaxID=205917 RepID=A0A4Y9YYB2_9AGAM|nr:hypothetical protein EVG20_g4548 [Dentipellis fragilis]
MAVAVASSSRRTSNLNPASATHLHPASATRRPHANDVFKPKLPLDPFVNMDFRKREPIVVPSERLFSAAAGEPRRDVILVVGTPNTEDLSPLFASDQLAFSLVIIASHQPPTIPSKVQPAIRILRLATPLGLEQAGAVRFVNILEWAERVARSWRKNGGIGVRELDETDEGGSLGALAPPPNLLRSPNSNGSLHTSKSSPPSPLTSTLRLDSQSGEAASTSRSKRKSRASKREAKLPAADPSQRPFDALIHFLPRLSGISEKSLLKQAILITTISRPFLVAAIPPSLARPARPATKRKSFLGRTSVHSVYSLPPTPPISSGDSVSSLPTIGGTRHTRAHLVHLLPPPPKPQAPSRRSYSFSTSMNRVLSSIESFLLGFSHPVTPMDPNGAALSVDGLEPAKSFLSDSAAWAENVYTGMDLNWTVADMILSGCLDVDAPTGAVLQSPATSPPRAWVSGASDIIVAVNASTPALLGAMSPMSAPSPARTPPASHRRHYFPEADPPPVPKVQQRRTSLFSKQGPQLPTPPASDESVHERQTVSAPLPTVAPAHTRQRSISLGLPETSRAEKRKTSNPEVLEQKKSRWKFWKRGQR